MFTSIVKKVNSIKVVEHYLQDVSANSILQRVKTKEV